MDNEKVKLSKNHKLDNWAHTKVISIKIHIGSILVKAFDLWVKYVYWPRHWMVN